MVHILDRRTSTIGAGIVTLALALSASSGRSHAQDPASPPNPLQEARPSAVGVFADWLRGRFSEAELKALQPEELQVESHYCGCYDEPTPHYPYPLVVLRTPRGDLV